ncbi:MAG: hypothetical protein EA001_15860 [Oscillatoriales cyanobacterium]|nr:MAG: hypothetical protein EA001_15860 [Oscillatoriales cyanobacterium]
MAFFRQYVAPFLVVLIFAIALIAVSARIFLPNDLAAPAPISALESPVPIAQSPDVSAVSDRPSVGLPPSLSVLVQGVTPDGDLSASL